MRSVFPLLTAMTAAVIVMIPALALPTLFPSVSKTVPEVL
jgi:hypothetical protein